METWTEIWFCDGVGFYFKGVWLVSYNEDFKLGFDDAIFERFDASAIPIPNGRISKAVRSATKKI